MSPFRNPFPSLSKKPKEQPPELDVGKKMQEFMKEGLKPLKGRPKPSTSTPIANKAPTPTASKDEPNGEATEQPVQPDSDTKILAP